MKTRLAIISIVSLLISCISELPFDSDFVNDPIVISGLLSQASQAEIQISNTRNLNWTDSSTFNKPYSILLYEDNNLTYSHEGLDSIILLPFIPKEHAVYDLFLHVGNITTTANTSIPGRVKIQLADIRYTNISTLNHDRLSEVTIEWVDPVATQNYYEIQLIGSNGSPSQYYSFENISDPILLQEADLDFEPASFVFSDASFSGDRIQIKLLKAGFPKESWVILRTLSPEYYHYIKSWHKHIYHQYSGIEIDDKLDDIDYISLLLRGDPVPLYSNVNNGIGIFAGYSEDIKKFRIIQ